MKKLSLVLVFCLLLACNKNPESQEQSENSKASEEEIQSEEEVQGEEEVQSGEQALPPMVQVDDRIYVDTGYVNSMTKCGTADGQITSTVSTSESPSANDQGNFGPGYDYQFSDHGYISLEIDDRWIIFRDIAISYNGPPKMVANFTGKVIGTEEDRLLVEVTSYPEEFLFMDQVDKPVSLEIENLDYSKDGRVTTEGLEGRSVKVFFDGDLINTDPLTSSPVSLGQIYKIEVLD